MSLMPLFFSLMQLTSRLIMYYFERSGCHRHFSLFHMIALTRKFARHNLFAL